MKYLKFLFSMLFFSTLSVSAIVAARAETITFYHMFSKNTPSLPQTKILVESFEKNYKIDFTQGQGCAVKDRFNKENGPALVEMVTGRYWFSLQQKDGLCDIDIKPVRWLGYQKYYYNICVRSDSGIANIKDLLQSNKIINGSFASGSHGGHLFNEINKSYGTKIKSIEYKNSGAAALALVSKDVELAVILDFVADKQEKMGNMRCLVKGQPGQDLSGSKTLPKLPTVMTEAPNIFGLGVKNVTDQQYLQLLLASQNAKKNLDDKIPAHKFVAVDDKKIFSNLVKEEIETAIFGLYRLTKD